jgi:hypothetical protein
MGPFSLLASFTIAEAYESNSVSLILRSVGLFCAQDRHVLMNSRSVITDCRKLESTRLVLPRII